MIIFILHQDFETNVKQYKTDDVVESYKKFYIAEKRFYTYKGKLKPSTWKKREIPEWCHE